MANVHYSSGPTEIDRDDRQREIIVYANNVGVSAGDIITAAQNEIGQMNFPYGYSYKFVGQTRTMNDSFKEKSAEHWLLLLFSFTWFWRRNLKVSSIR